MVDIDRAYLETTKKLALLYMQTCSGMQWDDHHRRALAKAAQLFVKNYIEKYGFVDLLNGQAPAELDKFYISTSFLPHRYIRTFTSVEALEEAFTQQQQSRSSSRSNNKVSDTLLANEEQYLMVLGEPGTGKSTFLKWIGLLALKNNLNQFQHNCIPIFLELRQFKDRTFDLYQAIAVAFTSCEFPYLEEFLAKALAAGKFLLLLDGLDDLPYQQRQTAKQQIQDFSTQYALNRLIVSCRLGIYRQSLGKFADMVLVDWTERQIQTFISQWFGNYTDEEKQTAHKCWQLLQNHYPAKNLARHPFSLLLLCLVFRSRQSFTGNRSYLYQKAFRILLENQFMNRALANEQTFTTLSVELKENLSAALAYQGFVNSQICFTQSEIIAHIEQTLAQNINAPKHIDSETIWTDLKQQIFTEVQPQLFVFTQKAWQEYLSAHYIYVHSTIQRTVAENLHDRRWHEIFLLLSGIMAEGADQLLLAIEQQALTYINTRSLQTLIKWTNAITIDSESKYKPAAKRIASIFLAHLSSSELAAALSIAYILNMATDLANLLDLNLQVNEVLELDLAITLARVLDFDNETELNLALSLTSTLENTLEKLKLNKKTANFTLLTARLESLSNRIPDYEQPYEVQADFRQSIWQSWYSILKLEPSVFNLTALEVESLANYFYANLLLVQCKQSACIISAQFWQILEDRILLLPYY